MKPCTKCKIVLDEREFNKEARRADGLSQWCRACKRDHQRVRAKRLQEDPDFRLRHSLANKLLRLVQNGTVVKPTVCPVCARQGVMHAEFLSESDASLVRWRCRECALIESGKRIPCVCLWCREPFMAQRTQVRRASDPSSRGGRYCSAKCRNAWMHNTAEHMKSTPASERSSSDVVFISDRF